MADKIKVAIITEFHPVDMISFHKLFWSFDEFECYIQSFDMFASDDKNNEQYDAVVYYNLSIPLPQEGSAIRKYIENKLGNTNQGIFLLHHAICCYRGWQVWTDLTGIEDRRFKYHWDQTVRYDISDSNHPITQGIRPWAMIDETYTINETDENSQMLITTDHPNSMKGIAWTRQYKNSRVFCYESGHDDFAYNDINFKEVLRLGILWCANKI
jgi:uncharacterized protein